MSLNWDILLGQWLPRLIEWEYPDCPTEAYQNQCIQPITKRNSKLYPYYVGESVLKYHPMPNDHQRIWSHQQYRACGYCSKRPPRWLMNLRLVCRSFNEYICTRRVLWQRLGLQIRSAHCIVRPWHSPSLFGIEGFFVPLIYPLYNLTVVFQPTFVEQDYVRMLSQCQEPHHTRWTVLALLGSINMATPNLLNAMRVAIRETQASLRDQKHCLQRSTQIRARTLSVARYLYEHMPRRLGYQKSETSPERALGVTRLLRKRVRITDEEEKTKEEEEDDNSE